MIAPSAGRAMTFVCCLFNAKEILPTGIYPLYFPAISCLSRGIRGFRGFLVGILRVILEKSQRRKSIDKRISELYN